MKCPVCNDVDLTLSERQGVEIDYCPQCRGVWLDRGELDKIVDRIRDSDTSLRRPAPEYRPSDDDDDDDERHYDPYSGKYKREDYSSAERSRRPPKRKKRDFLDDLFDFDLFG